MKLIITNDKWFYSITTLVIVISAFIFIPKLSPRVLHLKNSTLLNNFINKTVTEKKIDPVKFWEMREFYCPGSFIFNHDASTFLTYSCNWLTSTDSFTIEPSLHAPSSVTEGNIILQTSQVLIYKVKNELTISFILPIDEMKKANGFFDYKKNDMEIMNDKFWLDKTIIRL